MKLKLNGKNGKKKNGNGNGGHRNGNGNGNGGPKSWAKLALLGLAVLLVGVLLLRQVDRLRGPKRVVWVASANLAAGSLISSDDLERAELRASRVPDNAVAAETDLAGQRLARPKREGEPITEDDVQRRGDGRQAQAASLAELLPAGRVLTQVRVDVQSVLMGELRFGDRFSLVASGRERTGVVAADAYFLAWIDPALLAGGGNGDDDSDERRSGFLASLLELPPGVFGSGGGGGAVGRSGTNVLLALYPQDVLPVSQAQATGEALSLVIHGKKEVAAGQMLSLQTSRVRDVELIDGADQEILHFRQ